MSEHAARYWDHESEHPRDLMEMIEESLVAGRIDRKWQLWLCGCARRVEHAIASEPLRQLIDLAELTADGLFSEEELEIERERRLPRGAWHYAPFDEAIQIVGPVTFPTGHADKFESGCHAIDTWAGKGNRPEEYRAHVALLKEIFPNPLRPVAFDPVWRTSTTVGLAQAMYEARRFANMPILADALEEAGCDLPDVLVHCRSETAPHVRGCWVVDLVLGKS